MTRQVQDLHPATIDYDLILNPAKNMSVNNLEVLKAVIA
jgi:hypothetical protein